MPRAMRRKIFTGVGNAHFITFSTFGKRRLLSTPQARQIVISQLGRLASQGRVKVSGFVVMPDHVHALLWFDDDEVLPEVVGVWKSTSSIYLRRMYEQTMPEMIGHLKTFRSGRERVCFWQRRYYDFNISSHKKLREKLNYMHLNPVNKGLCKGPEDWRWSSARWYTLGKSVGVKIEPGCSEGFGMRTSSPLGCPPIPAGRVGHPPLRRCGM